VNLEAYLTSKRIDSSAFQKGEPELWKSWDREFEEMHPNSFTMQKLNLINPIRRKYPLKVTEKPVEKTTTEQPSATPPTDSEPKPGPSPNPKPSIPKPVFKPKPKIS